MQCTRIPFWYDASNLIWSVVFQIVKNPCWVWRQQSECSGWFNGGCWDIFSVPEVLTGSFHIFYQWNFCATRTAVAALARLGRVSLGLVGLLAVAHIQPCQTRDGYMKSDSVVSCASRSHSNLNTMWKDLNWLLSDLLARAPRGRRASAFFQGPRSHQNVVPTPVSQWAVYTAQWIWNWINRQWVIELIWWTF